MTDPTEVVTLDAPRPDPDAEPTTELGPAADVVRPINGAGLVQIYPRGPTLGRRHPIRRESVVIGRDPACQVHVADKSVSRTHARIDLRPDGRYHVTDLGSRNGTAVNDTPVRTAPLRDGDRVRVGKCVFRFLLAGSLEDGYHDELYAHAALDPLTGAHNRRSLEEFLEREVARAARHARPLSLLMLDVDGFKQVNDRRGHPAGDAVLRALADVVRDHVRRHDLLARYGGDEFAVALPETPADLGFLCGDRIRAAVAARRFEAGGEEFGVTVSVGVGGWGPGVTARGLIERADARLYDAKRAGRNRVRL